MHRDQTAKRRLAVDLRAAGFSVVETDPGAKALERAKYFSALLVDVDLPDVHGGEICRMLRSSGSTARLPIVQIVHDQSRAAAGVCIANGSALGPVTDRSHRCSRACWAQHAARLIR